jgi:ribonuclease BN (tRNA processing enzyme)
MRLVFLGTGGFHPNERRHTACLLVPEAGLALDAGTGAFRLADRLVRDDLDLFLTHAHLDHVAGLTFLLVPLLSGRIRTVRLHGPADKLEAVRRHLFDGALFPVLPAFEWRPLEDRVVLPDGAVVTHVPLVHPGGSVGYRVDWPHGPSLAYVTDTTVDGSYAEFVRGVDLLVHECYFPDDRAEWAAVTGHSHLTPVLELARDAGVRRLALVHVDPQRAEDDPVGLAARRAIFPDAFLPEDLDEVELPGPA